MHTPGPWAVWEWADEGREIAVGPSIGGVAICDVVKVNGIGIETEQVWETAKVNARLIATAPEMLEALKFAKGCLQDAELFGAATTVDAVIARAEGR